MNRAFAGARAVFLDMNGVLVFGHDRLSSDEDFFANYQACGGKTLDAATVVPAVSQAVAELARLYAGGLRDVCFPSVFEVLCEQGQAQAEAQLLADVIAAHELGSLSAEARRVVPQLARQFDLTLISNLWSSPARWRRHFDDAGIDRCFRAMVFSSDIAMNRPAPAIFEHALRLAGADAATTVMVGDDLHRDLAPAAALGMRAVWVTASGTTQLGVDAVVRIIGELVA